MKKYFKSPGRNKSPKSRVSFLLSPPLLRSRLNSQSLLVSQWFSIQNTFPNRNSCRHYHRFPKLEKKKKKLTPNVPETSANAAVT